jgi:glycosyltransferase involved in cell wall biosynthesis
MKKKIKVLHLGYSDNYGGASVAMNRLNDSLCLINSIDSRIAVILPSKNSNVICLSPNILERFWAYIRTRLSYKVVQIFQKNLNSSGRSINFFPSSVIRRINSLEFDILHLHWIGNETIRLESLVKIIKPIVWTFHDNWPLLGAEHTDIDSSNRFVEGYKVLNKLNNARGIDIDKWTWNRKKNVFNKLNIQPVVVSSWLYDETKRSYLWRDSNPKIIHNCINLDSWAILDKFKSREFLNISSGDKVVVFGAINAFTDELKGYNNLEKAILTLGKKLINDNITLLVFGDTDIKKINLSSNILLRSVGKIYDLELLNKAYCSADVVVVPSYRETFGQIAIEAITCGVPVVCFKTSGLLDIIIDSHNGFLCDPFDTNDLSLKIMKSFHTEWDRNSMRNDIEKRFGFNTIGKKYESLYKQIIQ